MTHALTVVLKPGYAPIEQYGDIPAMTQGAWTDIYALGCVVLLRDHRQDADVVGRAADGRPARAARDRAPRAATATRSCAPSTPRCRSGPSDRPQNEREFRALLDADRPGRRPRRIASAAETLRLRASIDEMPEPRAVPRICRTWPPSGDASRAARRPWRPDPPRRRTSRTSSRSPTPASCRCRGPRGRPAPSPPAPCSASRIPVLRPGAAPFLGSAPAADPAAPAHWLGDDHRRHVALRCVRRGRGLGPGRRACRPAAASRRPRRRAPPRRTRGCHRRADRADRSPVTAPRGTQRPRADRFSVTDTAPTGHRARDAAARAPRSRVRSAPPTRPGHGTRGIPRRRAGPGRRQVQ